MNVELRLARLERQVRRWRAATMGLVLVGLAGAVAGAQRQREPKAPAALTATGLTIVGTDGKPLATLGADKSSGGGGGSGALFVLHNAAGEPMVTARARDDAAEVTVGPPGALNADTATSVAWAKAGGGAVVVRAAKGGGEASMRVEPEGEGAGAFTAVGPDGKPFWRSGVPKRQLVPFQPGQ